MIGFLRILTFIYILFSITTPAYTEEYPDDADAYRRGQELAKSGVYFSAASYYYENDKDMKQALEWVDKAVANNPKAYWIVLLKAKIQVKLKDNKGANATATQALALAKEDQDDAYVKMAEKIIAETKGK